MTNQDQAAPKTRRGAELPEHIVTSLQRQKARVDAANERASAERATLDAMLVRYHLQRGFPTEALGRVVGFTKQRVHQLVVKERNARDRS